MRLERRVSEFRILDREHKLLNLCAASGGDGKGTRVPGKRMEGEPRASNEGESSQGPGHEFRQVITGDVLHDLTAAARQRAIRERNGGADNQIAKSAKTQTEGATVVGGEHAADGGFFRPQRIKRQPLAILRQRLQSLDRAACFDGYGE